MWPRTTFDGRACLTPPPALPGLSAKLSSLKLDFAPDSLFFMKLAIRFAPGISELTLIERDTDETVSSPSTLFSST